MKIMLSAGEVSGDMHGSLLAKEILRIKPDTELLGFGGNLMKASGVRLFRNFAEYSVMGIWEVAKNLRRIKQLLQDLTSFMVAERPDLLVLIDYPDFNWRLAKQAKVLNIPVFSYIPPSAWAWRKGRAKSCAKLADEFIAVFPHELSPYQEVGAKISFLGNPLVDIVKPELLAEEAWAFFDVSYDDKIVLLLPGSRKQEIELLLPKMLDAVKMLVAQAQKCNLSVRFFLPIADAKLEERIKSLIAWAGLTSEITLAHEKRYSLMQISTVAMATSGTVIMEAALLGLPCVVLYRMAKLNFLIAKLLIHIKSISLPNILLEENFQPELIQEDVTPVRISYEIVRFYDDTYREKVKNKLYLASQKLGAPGATKRIAERILEVAGRSKID